MLYEALRGVQGTEQVGQLLDHQSERNMRIVSWNCRRASAKSGVWDYLQELAPDVALLQEVCGIPAPMTDTWSILESRPIRRTGIPQAFSNIIMVRGNVGERIRLGNSRPWVQAELDRFSGNLLVAKVHPASSAPFVAVCGYCPAWPIDRQRLVGIDTTGVQLTQNADVWAADLLWSSLEELRLQPDDPWVIGGDHNLCETFDGWRGGPRGNREHLDRMTALGLTDALRESQGALTPTFRAPRTGKVSSQLDYLFMTKVIADRVVKCWVGDQTRVFSGLSDHLPVIADLTFGT